MKRFTLLRIAVVGLASCPATASAFDFPRLCAKKCVETERVVLPARQIEVVTERPRVTVREEVPTREVMRQVVREAAPVREVYREAAPVREISTVGTIYMPVTERAVVQPQAREVVRELVREESCGFESMQKTILRGEMAKLELQRNIEMQKKLLECLSSSSSSTLTNEGRTNLEQKVSQLTSDMEKLNTRLTSVEKLIMYHDAMLLAKKGEAGAEADGLKIRIDNLERLVLFLEKKATTEGAVPKVGEPLGTPMSIPTIPTPMPTTKPTGTAK